jgi:uncharacterized protein involved in outer membrane biogenesis
VVGLRIGEPEGPDAGAAALSFERLFANLQLQSILHRGAVLAELRLDKPFLHLARAADGRLNWSDLIDEFAAQPKSEGAPARFALHNIQVVDGSIRVDDRLAGREHHVDGLNIGLPFISNLPSKVDVFVEPLLQARVNDAALELRGKARPFSEARETDLDIALDDVELPGYLVYLPLDLGFKLSSAQLSSRLRLTFAQPADGSPRLALDGTLDLAALRLAEASDAPLLQVAAVHAEVAEFAPLESRLHLGLLRIEAPELTLARAADGRLNLQAFAAVSRPEEAAEPASAGPASDEPASGAFSYRVDKVELSDGRVSVADAAVTPAFTSAINNIALQAEGLASEGEAAQLSLSLALEGGGTLEHAGSLSPAPLKLAGKVTLAGVELPPYQPYLAAGIPGGTLDSGQLGASLDYAIDSTRSGEGAVVLNAQRIDLAALALRLKDAKQPWLQLARLGVSGLKLDPAVRRVDIAALALDAPQLELVRGREGAIDVAAMFAGENAPPAATAQAPGAQAPQGAAPPWSVALADIKLAEGVLLAEDRFPSRPVKVELDKIALSGKGFSTAPGARTAFDLSLRANKRGTAKAAGSIGLDPIGGEATVDLRNLDLLLARAYAGDELQVDVSSGHFGARGRVQFALGKGNELDLRYAGNAGIEDFASIDRLNKADFVKWKRFEVSGVDFRLAPFSLAIGEVRLEDFYTKLILDAKGALNLREVTAAPEAEAPPKPVEGKAQAELPAAAPAPPIRVDKVVISGGHVEYSDRFIRPNYDADLTGMHGSLEGLSSDPATIAKLQLDGSVGGTAPVAVSGELNPFRQDRYLDITGSVRDFELTGVSAYSGRYVGYGIEKGKLSAELHYKVEERKLTATNRVFLDQLTFGKKVDSPDALKLPVQLAVSLLKNRRGEIDVNVPISGTLDDPEFSVGGLVVRAILNLIGKAITSPFALLGSVFGGGEDLSNVVFAPGRARLEDAALAKLENLASAMKDRPALKLEVAGRVDPQSDAAGLRQVALERQVAAVKAETLADDDKQVPPLDEIQVSPKEYPELLRKAYKNADFSKERNFVGFIKDKPVAEMEALMRTNVAVGDEELSALARARAQRVASWLVEQGGVPAGRVFQVAPRSGSDGAKADVPASRVEFSLK